jgi:hypothetical protein
MNAEPEKALPGGLNSKYTKNLAMVIAIRKNKASVIIWAPEAKTT